MTKSAQHIAIIAILLSTLSGLASAQKRANTSTTQANLHIQVNVVEVVMTDQSPKATLQAAVNYSISAIQPRTSVTKEIRQMQTAEGKSTRNVETTTIVVE
jgi:hypothetical protein